MKENNTNNLEAVCKENETLEHRQLNIKYRNVLAHMFKCYDSRKCDYQLHENNIKYCLYHTKGKRF